MNDFSDRHPIAGLAVTLVGSSDRAGALRVAALLCGRAPDETPSELDVGGDDDATFAVELAERLASDSLDGVAGNTAVVLEPTVDIVEVALVLEHMLDARRPTVPVAIRDVVAVTSVAEICAVLFGRVDPSASLPRGEDYASPGRLAGRLEFASVIVLTDAMDAAAPADTRLVQAFLARLAPSARVVDLDGATRVQPASALLVRGRAHRLGATMGWQRELADGESRPASSERSELCASFVFATRGRFIRSGSMMQCRHA